MCTCYYIIPTKYIFNPSFKLKFQKFYFEKQELHYDEDNKKVISEL